MATTREARKQKSILTTATGTHFLIPKPSIDGNEKVVTVLLRMVMGNTNDNEDI